MPALACVSGLLVLLAAAAGAAGGRASTSDVDAAIDRVLATVEFDKVPYVATRQLYAGARSGKHQAWMEVETRRNGGRFEFLVLSEQGAGRTRDRVLRGVLESEGSGASRESTLNRRYYDFEPEPSPSGRLERVRLKPRFADQRLVDGVLTIGPDGHPVSLEGQLARSPSFWIRSVTVLTTYARFGAVSMPISVESLADVRFIGQSSFAMRYTYQMVNGRPVRATALPPEDHPSPRLVALHESLRH